MITCKALTELVTDYLDGRLGVGQRLAFHIHLGLCRSCRTYLRQTQATVRLTGKLPIEPMPDAVQSELLRRFRDWRTAPDREDPDGRP